MISRRQMLPRVLGLLVAATAAACLSFPLWVDYVTVPPWVLVRIPERMKRHQPGMSHPQVWQQLGLTGYRPYGMDSGPCNGYREGSRLWPGCGLLLVFPVLNGAYFAPWESFGRTAPSSRKTRPDTSARLPGWRSPGEGAAGRHRGPAHRRTPLGGIRKSPAHDPHHPTTLRSGVPLVASLLHHIPEGFQPAVAARSRLASMLPGVIPSVGRDAHLLRPNTSLNALLLQGCTRQAPTARESFPGCRGAGSRAKDG